MLALTFLMIAAQSAPAAPAAAAAVQPSVGASFESKKSLPELEACLTEKLAKYGEVTAVPIENTKTLMFRITNEAPMVIDLSPPAVTITTKYPGWAKPLVQSCL